ncbi:voltage-gated potassium channel [Oxalobacteraceae bacterium GrIS 1.11]
MKNTKLAWPVSPVLLGALMLSIPAFYLVLTGAAPIYRSAGHWMYALVALLVGLDIALRRHHGRLRLVSTLSRLDLLLLLGALASAWPTTQSWPVAEWLLRLAYCGVVFLRLSTVVTKYIAPHRLMQIIALGVAVLTVSGAGFYWLEPKVLTFADGVWLAFITGATVGYGDLVPSTPASRIFAGFIVLLGYALFSIVTASISALLVGEDEKKMKRELHSDMRLLRAEIASLREELRASFTKPPRHKGEEDAR